MRKIVALLMVICMLVMVGCEEAKPLEVTEENKEEVLESLRIDLEPAKLVKGKVPDRHEEVSYANYELPSIENYAPIVKGNGEIDVEIFLPLENNGSKIQDVVMIAAENFNKQEYKNSNGQTMSVTVRALESSLAEDFIQTGAYKPEGYIAPNELYGLTLKDSKLISSKLCGNTIGIAMENSKYMDLLNDFGEVSIDTVVKANLDGNMSIGYTNPINNPTGLNFVVSMLGYFDKENPSSFEATTDFSEFQNAVPSVSYSTEQMIKAVENGVINAFVIERQAFESNEELTSQFTFMPFGVRQDYPLYCIGAIAEKEENLIRFSEFFQTNLIQSIATRIGFNNSIGYESLIDVNKYYPGIIEEILKFWKEDKTSSNINALFVSDISGSMEGSEIEALKKSLMNSMTYINEDVKIGMLTYNHNVFYKLPIDKFSMQQQEYFAGATESLTAGGGTATNDAILMACKILNEEVKKDKTTKPMIIVLSDGNTESGYTLEYVKPLIAAYHIPIYTIGYGKYADIDELKEIADINGGAFINANTDDVGYQIKTLFNTQF